MLKGQVHLDSADHHAEHGRYEPSDRGYHADPPMTFAATDNTNNCSNSTAGNSNTPCANRTDTCGILSCPVWGITDFNSPNVIPA
jgi:hypothetical protein